MCAGESATVYKVMDPSGARIAFDSSSNDSSVSVEPPLLLVHGAVDAALTVNDAGAARTKIGLPATAGPLTKEKVGSVEDLLTATRRADPPGDPPGRHELTPGGIKSADGAESVFMDLDRSLLRARPSIPCLEPSLVSHVTDTSVTGQVTARSVQFVNVEVREHLYTTGSGGGRNRGGLTPPMELAWDAHSVSISTLDDYEANRGPRRSPMALRSTDDMHMSGSLDDGFESEELQAATHDETEDVQPNSYPTSEPTSPGRDLEAGLYQEFQQRFRVADAVEPRKNRLGLRGIFRKRRQAKSSKTNSSFGQM